VDPDKAAAKISMSGRTFFFCSLECKEEFGRNSGKYLDNGGKDKQCGCCDYWEGRMILKKCSALFTVKKGSTKAGRGRRRSKDWHKKELTQDEAGALVRK